MELRHSLKIVIRCTIKRQLSFSVSDNYFSGFGFFNGIRALRVRVPFLSDSGSVALSGDRALIVL